MAMFSFKLQPVLNVRVQQEDNLKNELGKAMQKLEAEKFQLQQLENALSDLVKEFNEKTKKTTVHSLIEFNEYLSLLNSKIKLQKENVNIAVQNVDKIRDELVEAIKARQILDKYREKKLEEYALEQKRLEQRTNDEIVTYKHRTDVAEND
jgi:flagellar FliJ protein